MMICVDNGLQLESIRICFCLFFVYQHFQHSYQLNTQASSVYCVFTMAFVTVCTTLLLNRIICSWFQCELGLLYTDFSDLPRSSFSRPSLLFYSFALDSLLPLSVQTQAMRYFHDENVYWANIQNRVSRISQNVQSSFLGAQWFLLSL